MRCDECLRTLIEYSATKRKDGSYFIIYKCNNCKTKHRIDTKQLIVQESIID